MESVIDFIKGQTVNFIEEEQHGIYRTIDGKHKLYPYRMLESIEEQSGVENIVYSDAPIERQKFNYVRNNKGVKAEIFDTVTIDEIKSNIEKYRMGKNEPSIGTGRFKSYITIEIKNNILNSSS